MSEKKLYGGAGRVIFEHVDGAVYAERCQRPRLATIVRPHQTEVGRAVSLRFKKLVCRAEPWPQGVRWVKGQWALVDLPKGRVVSAGFPTLDELASACGFEVDRG